MDGKFQVGGGTNYSGIPIGPKWKPGFTKAIQYWVPSIATSAITIYKGKEFSEWNGHALITSLKDKSLRKLIFDDLSNVKESVIFKNKIGRIRDIQVHPELLETQDLDQKIDLSMQFIERQLLILRNTFLKKEEVIFKKLEIQPK